MLCTGRRSCPSQFTLAQRRAHRSSSLTSRSTTKDAESLTVGVVLGPSESDSRCDNRKTAGPLVQHDGEQYYMWYYCQGTTTHNLSSILPLGDVALATSPDGFNWTRQEGPLPGGAVMIPRAGDASAFDSAILGCSCVLKVQDKWHMYYSGGPEDGNPRIPGFPMRGGLATSSDGLNWERVQGSGQYGSILDVGGEGEHDAAFIGWPSVVQEGPESFIMIYHSAVFTPTPTGGMDPKWILARAVSKDGVEWSKTGLCEITGRNTSSDAFDTKGLGTRDVVMLDDGEFLMFAEGVSDSGQHNIAVMRSQDQGKTWNICNDGKPVIVGPNSGSVGTACVVRPHGGGGDDWWVYCVTAAKGAFSIALAMSSTGAEGPFKWYEA